MEEKEIQQGANLAGSREQGSKLHAPGSVLSYDDAIRLKEEERVQGLRVKGKQMPFGGSWRYDKDADELTLEVPPPTMG